MSINIHQPSGWRKITLVDFGGGSLQTDPQDDDCNEKDTQLFDPALGVEQDTSPAMDSDRCCHVGTLLEPVCF